MKRKVQKGLFFESVIQNPDFSKMERELLAHWYKSGIVKKYLTKNSKSKKLFSFLDGPITANNPMGVHHGWGRTYKDLFQRFKNMQGFRQRFQNGFDAQGLWVEVNVEKELGLKTKKDIENLVQGDTFASIAKFVQACKDRVNKFAQVQTDQSKRLGYFMDWDNSYITMSDENNYMIWYFLSKCQEKGLIYEGLDSVPWCPRCATAISQHEILTEGYREIKHTAVTLKYPIVGRSNEYLLVWTTTPWTLPGNVAIAVNPKLIYSRVKVGNDIYYIAKDRIIPVLGVDVEVLEELLGERLLAISYIGPFDDLSAVDAARRENPRTFHITVDGGEFVTAQEGTGLVHIAPGAGHEDFVLAKENKLTVIHSIDEQAVFLAGFGPLSGKKASNPKPIIGRLKKIGPALPRGGYLVKEEQYTHRYPVCWRCDTELVFRAVPEWYIAMDPIRNTMAEITRNINWIPEFCRERELDWIKNMGDWLISKKRYWGLALPIWKCNLCGWFTVISGKEELKKKEVSGWDKFFSHSPHRPWVDSVEIRCEKCGEAAKRIADVGNPWLDAGIVPFSTMPKDWYPADFITESFPGQFKGWFYSLLAMAAVLEGTEPFKTVLGFGTLLGEDGRPMHKSWGNMIEFNEGADRIGVDVMRWMYVTQDPAKNLLFGYKVADETRRNFHLPLWNIYNFFVTYSNFDGWTPKRTTNYQPPTTNYILDKWILVRLKQVVYTVTESLNHYDAAFASQAIGQLVSDVSGWYIRRSRDRVGPSSTRSLIGRGWPTSQNTKDKGEFYKTTHYVLATLCKLLAPMVPFIADLIFMNLTKEESVHLTSWPIVEAPDKKEIELLEAMSEVRHAAEIGHAQRKALKIKVRQPLARATFSAPIKAPSRFLLGLLENELNVKRVLWKKKRVNQITVALDTRISQELEEEGKTRDLVREIQEERRRQGFGLGDRVIVTTSWLPTKRRLVAWIKEKTLTDKLDLGKRMVVSKL